jgi:hypothetical protein
MNKIFIVFICLLLSFCVSESPENEEPVNQTDQNSQEDVSADTQADESDNSEEHENSSETEDDPIFSGLTEEQAEFVKRYINKMVYMVYFSEDADQNETYMNSAVNKANSFLIENNLTAIDLDQVEQLKEEQALAYEEQTGLSESIIQWLANKLNADIYIEIYLETTSSTQIGGKHYGTAVVEIKAYETSTAVLMGSASFSTSEHEYSTISRENAVYTAIELAINNTMPELIEQVKMNMRNSAVSGIRYEIIIQNPLGDRIMSNFWEKLSHHVEDIQSISQSEQEIHYNIWYIGSMVELKSLIYNITETISGLQNMEMVYSRGKSITFHTGY